MTETPDNVVPIKPKEPQRPEPQVRVLSDATPRRRGSGLSMGMFVEIDEPEPTSEAEPPPDAS